MAYPQEIVGRYVADAIKIALKPGVIVKHLAVSQPEGLVADALTVIGK